MSNRVKYDDNELDEVVTDAGMHFERMSNKGWFLSGQRSDGSEIAIWIRGKVILVEEWPAPPAAMKGGDTACLDAQDEAVSRLVEAVETLIDAAGTAETTLAHALMDGMIDPKVEDRFEAWRKELLAAHGMARAALAATPQPAPAPAADERDEIERIICDAFTCDLRGRGDEDGAFWQTAADALLAAGYRKADALLAERDALIHDIERAKASESSLLAEVEEARA